MPLDLMLFSSKLKVLLNQLLLSDTEVSDSTGIPFQRFHELVTGQAEPSGDEVLILADFFKCDYKLFISNEKITSISQTEILFRRFSSDFSKEDRMAVREVYYMAEHECFLQQLLNKTLGNRNFSQLPIGGVFKQHGIDGATSLRKHLGYTDTEISRNVFDDMRRINFHVFRRRLGNSNISGVAFKHPEAGKCILINYDQDIYRQRFTVVHEAAHAIFDLDDQNEINVSFAKWDKSDLKEVRANSFASAFLLPPQIISNQYRSIKYNDDEFVAKANQLLVNPETLSIALLKATIIDKQEQERLKHKKIPTHLKSDAELPASLSANARHRKTALLQRGLSDYYVRLCFDAYAQELVSLAKVAEMLLLSEEEINDIKFLYGVNE